MVASPVVGRKTLLLMSLAICVGLLLLGVAAVAHAQAVEKVLLRQVDSTHFPTLSVYFEVYNADGQFFTDLQSEALQIIENGQPHAPLGVTLLTPGAHLILVFNYGPEWSVGYAQRSRFQYLRQHWLDWAQAQPANTYDRLSLITNSGLQLVRNGDPARWADWLETVRPDLQRETASLNGLTRALDLASSVDPTNPQRPVIFFVTAPLPGSTLPALADLRQRAQTQGVPVHVWLVANARAPTRLPQNYAALNDLAIQSGGQFLLFSGPEPLPDIEPLLQPLRFNYRATYTSTLTTSGSHELVVRVMQNGTTLDSEPLTFDLNVLPPNPILLAPPAQITRSWEASAEREPRLSPSTYAFALITEFPDQHPRPLRAARLFVNDALVVERLQAPFETLEWPLEQITTGGRFRIRVEVEDSLGLKGQSQEWPLEVLIAEPPRSLPEQAMARLTTPQVLPLWALIMSAAMLGLILWRWRAYHRLTQSLYTRLAPGKDKGATPVKRSTPSTFPTATPPQEAPAWLVWLRSEDVPFFFVQDASADPQGEMRFFALPQAEVTLGSDPHRAVLCFPHPSVESVHARIVPGPEGFKLVDAGSTAGTWLNAAPLPPEGALLNHGDIFHLGSVALRFETPHPAPPPYPMLLPYEDTL
ncbi:FHA domain-containing protein [uncultured Thermanaerothrix sp.]|uniref:FHA domain-containing protein n=1 Tax=uncultured Thermanaerothrix sp. TaxID=1195149 RepID=UPI002615226C|nr:FHA domain-containing protein [uncultured Thermanaerothrix sp.]